METKSGVTLEILGALLGVPMRAQRVLPGLYDPTGLSFDNPHGGVSTELNSIIGGGNEPYRMVPTLVPGQIGIEDILAGKQKLTPEQIRRMVEYAKTRETEVPTFKTLNEALDYETRRHETLDKGYLPTRPEDILSQLYLLLSGALR